MNIPPTYSVTEPNKVIWDDTYLTKQVANGMLTQYEFPCSRCDGCGHSPDSYNGVLRECPKCHASLTNRTIKIKTQHKCEECGTVMFLCVDNRCHPIVTAFLVPSPISELATKVDDYI